MTTGKLNMMKGNVRNNGFGFFISNERSNDIPTGNKTGNKRYFLQMSFSKTKD